MRVDVVLDLECRHALMRLMVSQGYNIDVTKQKFDKMLSYYVAEFMTECGGVTIDPPLTIPYVGPNTQQYPIILDIPENLEKIPQYFKLPNWEAVILNIATLHLIPDTYPKPAIFHDPFNEELFLRYWVYTGAEQLTIDYNTPFRLPDYYIDNRQWPDEIGLTGPLPQWTTRWHVPGAKRKRKLLKISARDVEHLYKIAKHFSILPLRHKTPESTLSIVLEAFHYKFLIPKPRDILDTQPMP
jgi:hypothetical protein